MSTESGSGTAEYDQLLAEATVQLEKLRAVLQRQQARLGEIPGMDSVLSMLMGWDQSVVVSALAAALTITTAADNMGAPGENDRSATYPLGWFSDMDGDAAPSDDYVWQPVLQLEGLCLPMDVWHHSKQDCDDFICKQILGKLMLPDRPLSGG